MMKELLRLVLVLGCLQLGLHSVHAQEEAKEKADTKEATKSAAKEDSKKEEASKPEDSKPEDSKEEDSKEEDSKEEDSKEEEVLAGHSYHGEAFNEGPRQAAYLMEGLGRVRFPVTTDKPEAAKFVEQGVAQLHGFWYLEAERSFRQAAAIDPDCAMAYWGMAMANRNNSKRSKEFIAEADKRKDDASKREQLYIGALKAYLNESDKKKRSQRYIKALEKLIYEFPDDIEARAFLALQLWGSRSDGIPISSHLAVDALLQQVFAEEPMHPAHHYRIHLWDYEKPDIAVTSAAKCGQSLPAIAHMWHMPGHIFSRLKRYNDAAWQQEASARVDHAHMMRDRVMPDQIHNFAHNNEWLIRNLNHVGRVHDALDLAKNMTELPRHPKYNTLKRRGSANYGRTRLLETLTRFELWDDLIALSETPYLGETDIPDKQIQYYRSLGRAYAETKQADLAAAQLTSLREFLADQEKQQKEAGEKAEKEKKEGVVDSDKIDEAADKAAEAAKEAGKSEEEIAEARQAEADKVKEEQLKAKSKEIEKAGKDARKRFDNPIREAKRAIAELEGYESLAKEDFKEALKKFEEAKGVDAMKLAWVRFKAGETDKAIEDARKHVSRHEKEVQPATLLAQLLHEAGKVDEAKKAFENLRKIATVADLDTPLFDRVSPLAKEFGCGEDWRISEELASDIGDRPDLDSLGPFRWAPQAAPEWTLKDAQGEAMSLKQFQGEPVVLIFYLGYGCLHCAEQLHKFAPMIDKFQEQGINLLAISTDDSEGLKMSINNYTGGPLPIPLLANADLDVFKSYRAYDDFEQQPLHGTFLIDGNGLVRWQDISYEPFMDPDFVLEEAGRLLAQ